MRKERLKKIIKRDIVVLIIGFLYLIFIKVTNISLSCPFYRTFHLKCPGCGLTRMCLSISNLNFKMAAEENILMFVLLPIFLFLLSIKDFKYINNDDKNFFKNQNLENIICIFLLIVVLLFTFLRNIYNF